MNHKYKEPNEKEHSQFIDKLREELAFDDPAVLSDYLASAERMKRTIRRRVFFSSVLLPTLHDLVGSLLPSGGGIRGWFTSWRLTGTTVAALAVLFWFLVPINLMTLVLQPVSADEQQAYKAFEDDEDYERAQRLYVEAAEGATTAHIQISALIGAAAAAWHGRDYGKAQHLYLDISDIALIQAAKRAWFNCDYQAAREIVEKRISKKTAEAHLILGGVYHSQGDMSAAEAHYQKVVSSDQKNEKWIEFAWFNLGVVHAARFKESREEKAWMRALHALEESIQAAVKKEDRIERIQEALKPFSEREINQCGAAYYTTEDLTPLAGLPELSSLLARFSSDPAV